MNEPFTAGLTPRRIEGFWAKVQKTDTCWNWTGNLNHLGYGRVWTTNRDRADRRGVGPMAHRVSWELANGPIPDGLLIDHICHNTACVNPDHLRPVNNKQNMEHRSGPRRNGSSGVRGVSWHSAANKWRAHVMHNKKFIHLGVFDDIEEAEKVALAKRLELFTHNEIDKAS